MEAKWDEWILSKRLKLRSARTTKTYTVVGRQCLEFARATGWPSDPRKITPLNVLEWYEELREDRSSNTQQLYTSTLLQFLEWSGNQFCSEVDLKIHPARTGKVDWLDSALQVGKFITSGKDVWDRATAAVISHTGARASEAADLRISDMHDGYVLLRGKGRKDRNIPVDREFWEDLRPYQEYRSSLRTTSDRFLVHLWQGKVWEYDGDSVNHLIFDMGTAFGRHVSPHTLRRTFGRLLWDQGRGMPLPVLKRIMGHKNLEQTIEYLGIDDADLSGAMDAFKPSFRPTTDLP